MHGVVRAGTDRMSADNVFYFALSPSRPVSVLVIDPEGAASDAALYLTTALDQSRTPAFKSDVVPLSRVTPSTIEHRSLIVLNDVGTVPVSLDELLKRFVGQGGGLLVALGERTPWAGAAPPLLPGTLGAPVDRRDRPRRHAGISRLQSPGLRSVQAAAQRRLHRGPVPEVPRVDPRP